MDRRIGYGRYTRTHGSAIGCVLALTLAGSAAAASSAPKQPVVRADSGLRCSGEAARPAHMALQMGKSNLMRLPEAVIHRSVGNANVVQALLVAPDTLYLVGVGVGSTNMILQGKSGVCTMVEIAVAVDVAALQATLAKVMPDEKDVRVTAAADSLVLTGTASDGAAIARIAELAAAYVSRPAGSLAQKADEAAGTPGASGGAAGGAPGTRVVNLLTVAAPQQVMLEVKIAEVSKVLLQRLEANLTWRSTSGSWAAALASNFLTGATGALFDANKSNGSRVAFGAQKDDGLVRILAEPTVMAISGQEGSFLAGGRFFIPVAQDNNRVTLEEREFGVGLRFTPTVMAGGRINLRVAPEVSELSREGIGLTASGISGSAILPVLTTRRASTTVQLHDGQSFAIGGLIRNNLTTNLKGLPVLGDVPVLGALFRSADYQQDRTELIFVVTARLVKPLPPNTALPTDTHVAPTPGEVLLGGRQEGAPRPLAAASQTPGSSGFELK